MPNRKAHAPSAQVAIGWLGRRPPSLASSFTDHALFGLRPVCASRQALKLPLPTLDPHTIPETTAYYNAMTVASTPCILYRFPTLHIVENMDNKSLPPSQTTSIRRVGESLQEPS
jgi:hypothetical protein